jgi:aspartate/methionine/tyrosine aminotransferase
VDDYGIEELRDAIAIRLETYNKIQVSSSQILVTAGSTEAIMLTLLGCIEQGDEVIVTDPCYVSYAPAIKFCGGRVVYIPLKEEENYQLDIDALEQKVTKKTKFILINNPVNPTGTVFSKKNLEDMAEIATKRNLTVITDEVYDVFLYDGAVHCSIASLPGMEERTITVNSFSKPYAMTGWRIGYMAGPKALIDQLCKLHVYEVVCCNAAVQKAAVAAYTGPQDSVKKMVEEFDARIKLVFSYMSKFQGVNVQKPRGAYYVFPNMSSYKIKSWDLSFRLIDEADVITTPGAPFGSNGEWHIRISCTSSRDNLKKSMDKIKEFLETIDRKS